jgi:hypothetical protein
MTEAAASLRSWISQTGLRPERITGALVLEAGRRAEFLLQPLRVIRPADLLVLEFRFVNFKRSGARLVRSNSGQPAYLIAIHQPQSFGEEAFLEIGNQQDLAKDKNLDGLEPAPGQPPRPKVPAVTQSLLQGRAHIRAAGPSQVAYRMPAGLQGIDRNLESLLEACRQWPLYLDGSARTDPGDFDFRGIIDVASLALPLRRLAVMARADLQSAIGVDGRRALDEIAVRLADDSLRAVREGGSADGRALRRLAQAAIGRVIRRGGDSARVDQTLGGLYVRAQASRHALARMRRAGDVLALARLPPEIFVAFLRPNPPGDDVTAIEMPYRLIGSPLASAGFTHATAPVTHKKRTELWHSRLGTRITGPGAVRVDDRPGVSTQSGGWDGEKLRFIWSPDYPGGTGDSFTKPLDHLDRQMLVKLTAGFDELRQDGQTPFVPRAVFVRRLMLSAMGGDLEAHRKFDPRPELVDLSAWAHRSAIGRDYYVRVEYSGFLFPFGHRASFVKLTERKFESLPTGGRVAALRQRFFIIVRDRMIAYPGGSPQPHEGRSLPFEQVICALEGATPDLGKPGFNQQDRVSTVTGDTDEAFFRMAFWPTRPTGGDYLFPLIGIDSAGRKTTFEMPLLFISELKNTAGSIPLIQDHWNGGGKAAQRRVPKLSGQTVRMAPSGPDAGDVDVPLIDAEILAISPKSALSATPAQTLQQFPRFGKMHAKLAAIERLTGVARVEELRYYQNYLNSGLDPAGAVFAEIVSAAKLGFGDDSPSSSVGGIATPDLKPSGLSARHGVTSGDVDTFHGGQFDPKQFFPDAMLLGVYPLRDLLKALPLNDSGSTPKIATVELSDRIRTQFRLTQTLEDGQPLEGLILGAGGASVFTLDTVIDAPIAAALPETSVTGSLTNFKISFLGALVIHFDQLRFFTRPGAKPDVDVDLNPKSGITFGGPLEFINRLKDFIPANGFSDPPNLDVTPAGITAGYSLGLPAIQVGILSLSNISLGAAFSLPFTGDPPTARFNFAERQNTFNLTVSMFGGGGFVALVAAADEIKEIEAQLDFGAQIAINLGVASGSVYVKGGFYFHYAADMIQFEGFVELGGRLSVLGLISVSLTFHLGLSYELLEKGGNNGIRASRLFGQATLTVEIDILFFSASVDVTVEKTFIGSEADPTFLDLVPDKTLWDEYCAAYA